MGYEPQSFFLKMLLGFSGILLNSYHYYNQYSCNHKIPKLVIQKWQVNSLSFIPPIVLRIYFFSFGLARMPDQCLFWKHHDCPALVKGKKLHIRLQICIMFYFYSQLVYVQINLNTLWKKHTPYCLKLTLSLYHSIWINMFPSIPHLMPDMFLSINQVPVEATTSSLPEHPEPYLCCGQQWQRKCC